MDIEKIFYRITLLAILTLGIGYYLFWQYVPPDADDRFLTSTIPAELDGQVFHWRYDIGWDFRIEMHDGLIYWEGMSGFFEGKKATVSPHYRKIRDQMYFISWPIPGIGVDSVVVDLEQHKVYGHSKANSKFFFVAGEVYCVSMEQSCAPPQH
jgi:hypothetical protein